jgi:hypothetical protein
MHEAAAASLSRSASDGPEQWTLFAVPWRGVRVNGIEVTSGIRVLADRDEIHVPGFAPVYFSTERLAAIRPCPVGAAALICPRCRQPIDADSPAVACPGCGVWHHGHDPLTCWSYAPRCALCPQPTELSAGFQWTPESL